MAARGLDHDLAKKREAAYDKNLERDCRAWIEAVTGESVAGDFHEALKDGQILCRLANAIKPKSVKKINASALPFKQMENIGAFLAAIADWGVPAPSSFQTVDLFEAKNMNQVVLCIQAVSRKATENGYRGPSIDIARPVLPE
eukprot:a676558_125.p2 GENE.a676558_125~~a676558_125.p2  ORF type:complete len:153 (+),score=43.57 a676558_125:32-460(+)